jgi:hypothetical protein
VTMGVDCTLNHPGAAASCEAAGRARTVIARPIEVSILPRAASPRVNACVRAVPGRGRQVIARGSDGALRDYPPNGRSRQDYGALMTLRRQLLIRGRNCASADGRAGFNVAGVVASRSARADPAAPPRFRSAALVAALSIGGRRRRHASAGAQEIGVTGLASPRTGLRRPNKLPGTAREPYQCSLIVTISAQLQLASGCFQEI